MRPLFLQLSRSCFVLLCIALWLMPWKPEVLMLDDLDSSWITVLHTAFAQKIPFGDTLLWHYGPLGILYAPSFHPSTWGIVFGLWSLLVGIWALAVMRLYPPENAEQTTIIIILSSLMGLAHDVFFISFSLLFFSLDRFKSEAFPRLLEVLLLLAMAITAWVKFSYLSLSMVTVFAVVAIRLIERRRALFLLGEYITFLLAVWAATGQSLSILPYYLQHAFLLSQGFSAMATYSRPFIVLLSYILAWGIWIAICHRGIPHERKLVRFLMAGTMLLFALLACKIGFIQSNDYHLNEALIFLFCFIALTKPFVWEQSSGALRKSFFASGAILILTLVPSFLPQLFPKTPPRTNAAPSAQAKRQTLSPPPSRSKLQMFEKQQANLRHAYAFPDLSGTVDIYSYKQNLLLAHGYNYSPRPIFQSYHAYTPELLRANRDFLRSEKAPDHILFTIEPLLGRYPTLDDSLSWLELFYRYHTTGVYSGYALLEKRKTPLPYSLHLVGKYRLLRGEPLSLLPYRHTPLWASITLKPRFLGKVAESLLMNIPIGIRITLPSGYTRYNALVPAIAKEGFLLSPLVDNTLQFVLLTSTEQPTLMAEQHITTLEVDVPNQYKHLASWFFEDAFDVTLYSISPPTESLSTVTHWKEAAPYATASIGALPVPVGPTREMYDQHVSFRANNRQPRLELRDEAKLRFPLSPTATRCSFTYGQFLGFKRPSDATHPINFRILGVDKQGQERLLHQAISPAPSVSKPITQFTTAVTMEAGLFESLIAWVAPSDPSVHTWSYLQLDPTCVR